MVETDMKVFHPLLGQTYGAWVVIDNTPVKEKNGMRRYLCKCKCGRHQLVYIHSLKHGLSTQCNSCAIKQRGNSNQTHGDSITKSKHHYLYRTWHDIKMRCFNQKCSDFHNWGGRGITMDPSWKEDYPSFKKYVLENLGERSRGLSLDRIDNDKNYEPGNLRWASKRDQRNNQRTLTTRKPGASGFNWVYQHSGKWIGDFRWGDMRHKTILASTPQDAYNLVIEKRLEIGAPIPI